MRTVTLPTRAALAAVAFLLALALATVAAWSAVADPSRAALATVTGAATTAPAPTTATTAPTTTSPSPTQPTSPSPTTPARPATNTTSPPAESPTTTVTSPATPSPTVATQPGSPPAVQQAGISPTTALLAVATLAIAALVLVLLHRRGGPEQPPPLVASRPQGGRASSPAGARPDEGLATMLVELGEAMIDAGYPVSEVQEVLQRVASAGGIPDAEVIALPTALLVSLPGQARVETAASTAGRAPLRLDQVDAVSRVAAAARTGQLSPAAVLVRLREVTTQPPPFGPVARTAGYVLLSAGLSLILNGGWVDLLVAAGLGALVGSVMLRVDWLPPGWRAVLPMLCAFGVAVAVFLLRRTSLEIGVLPPLVAPLVTFLPGALLTISVLELATGQMIAGAGRLAAGALQLVLLALGITAGAQLVGVPAISVSVAGEQPLGALAPWLGVAVFGVGVVMNKCARPSSMPWILLVLYVAYGAQVIGGLFLGAELSAFVGAVTMSPVAAFVARRPTGPATLVSVLPAFWLLVPGALGLVGVTMLLGENRSGFTSLYTTAVTMVAISFGVLIGRGMSLRRPPGRGAAR